MVCGGKDEKSYSRNMIFTNHNSYDHTAIIEIIESNIESKYYFALHDTCEVGKNFSNLLSQ